EKAIREGSIERVDSLISENGGSINDVLALSNGDMHWVTSDKTFSYEKTGGRTLECLAAMTPKGYHYKLIKPAPRQAPYNFYNACNVLGTPLMVAARMRNESMVTALLKRGANPNVFIEVSDYVPCSFYGISNLSGPWNCRRPYLCALFDAYMPLDSTTMDKADAIAKILLEHGAAFYKKPDNDERTAIWDAARLKSAYLLSEMLKKDFDINKEDVDGMTIMDWCLQERPQAGSHQMLHRRFVRALEKMGAKSHKASGPSREGSPTTKQADEADFAMGPCGGGAAQPGSPDGAAAPSPVAAPLPIPLPVVQKPDNSAEIALLQSRIWKLRMELEEARGNERAAAAQGTGWVTASMRSVDIMREISECERRIMELRN
nr:ankyrin repeat domain-containing protein [Clostridia bacterium]